jgi:predicted transposase/invertase (TIGR01784 family)
MAISIGFIEKATGKGKFIYMSVAQQLRQEGLEIGREEGIVTKAIAVAKNMLFKLHLDIDIVQKATELPKDELEKILQENK